MQQQARGYLKMARRQLWELFTPGSAQNRKGQELVEYALLAGFIAVSVAATIPYQITTPLSTIFNRIHMHLLANGG
jgi:Flp pilus assembly pilin Flp